MTTDLTPRQVRLQIKAQAAIAKQDRNRIAEAEAKVARATNQADMAHAMNLLAQARRLARIAP